MTQHILIIKNPATPPEPKFIPYPEIANVWRDDQMVTWQLREGLYWDPPVDDPKYPYPENLPVFFMGPDDTHAEWPGRQPEAVGALEGEHDRRIYVALCGRILAIGELPEVYHWAAWVNDGTGARVRIQTLHQSLGDLVDPDLPNQPLP